MIIQTDEIKLWNHLNFEGNKTYFFGAPVVKYVALLCTYI